MAKKTSIYLSDEMERAVAESGRSLIELVQAGLGKTRPRDQSAEVVHAARVLTRIANRIASGWRLVPPGQADHEATDTSS
jgi:hypothetical protein